MPSPLINPELPRHPKPTISFMPKPHQYREAIDALVRACRTGQGQVGAQRALNGVWNQNANSTFLQDEHRLNELLRGLTEQDRNAIAKALAQEFEAGVFEALKVLEELRISPFQDGYEGAAYHDFIGRLGGWEWPHE